jgi:hypothetical protein
VPEAFQDFRPGTGVQLIAIDQSAIHIEEHSLGLCHKIFHVLTHV